MIMERIPETGAMDDLEEVESYERLSRKYLGLVERLFVRRAYNLVKKSENRSNILALDVGTGPAHIPIRFAQKAPNLRFVSLDLSMNMLRKAQATINKEDYEDRIYLVCADAEQLPFRDETFHFVYSHSTIHHLSNTVPAIYEMIRVLKKGSRFIIRDLRRPPSFLLELYVRIFGKSYDSFMKKMYRESLQAGFTFREMKALCKKIESALVQARRFFITHVGIEGVKNE